jgi:pyruvate/2-oxoglutarate dehydrogenase complex dihydrolipoamide dehydrogenase (E3) component
LATLTPDLCVIGAGASGLAVAEAARRVGADIVMVERGPTGGQSLRAGALALRALAAAADRAVAARGNARFGVTGDEPKVQFRRVHDHIAEIIAQAAPDGAPARLAALGIPLIAATGTFVGPQTLQAGEDEIKARRFVIATGARTLVPDVPGLFSVPYFTPETIFDNTRKLTHLVVVGAGPMGLEIALCYRRLGCDVTVVEPLKALPGADPELAAIALRRMSEEGVTLLEDTSIVAVQARSQGIGVLIRRGDESASLDASHILVAGQRVPNLEALGLDAAKVRYGEPNAPTLKLGGSLRTNNPRIFAVGEAVGPGLDHQVAIEADIVVRAALLREPARYEPAAVPRMTLTDPEIAEIGLTEAMARGRFKTAYQVVRASFAENDRARAARDGMGLVKVVTSRAGRILGAGVVGRGAGELAALFSLALAQKLSLADLALFSAPYPTHADIVRQLGDAAAAKQAATAWQSRLFRLNRLLP